MSTGIEWTDETWNPTTGCDRVSPGCDHCYALGMAKRLKAMGQPDYQTDGDRKTSGPGFGLRVQKHRINQPIGWRKPRKIFVNSMSDLFHESVPTPWLADIFAVMAVTPRHTYQILTKRHGRMRSLLNDSSFGAKVADRVWGKGGKAAELPAWPLPNVWMGVSVEDQKWADIRIPALLDTPAAVRFLSCEPLLGPVDLSAWLPRAGCVLWDGTPTPADEAAMQEIVNAVGRMHGIGWVIVGGESGPGARPMHPDWARTLRDQCEAAGIPYLFKQWGAWAPTEYVGAGITRPNRIYVPDSTVPDPREGRELERMGKKAAGRELDGRTHDAYPVPATA